MKLKRDIYRELFISSLFSLMIVSMTPNPIQLWLDKSHQNTDDNIIHVGIIMKGVWQGYEKCHNLKYQFVTMIRSILQKSKRKNLHFVFLTDQKSVTYLDKILRKFIKKDFDDTTGLNVTYDFVDTHFITQTYIEAIGRMRPFFTSNSEAAKKYRDDLFLMGPFYHRIFPYEKFIMLDADLKFRIDIAELYDMFEDFSNNQVMGVGVDLAPHYRIAFREYRKNNPDTMVGEPGRFQGFNTGVVLYHLKNMRSSHLYNKYVNPENGYIATTDLAKKYQYASHLGDQCFFTLLGMEHPDMFYDLPCSYNFQLDMSLAAQKEIATIFPSYHNCSMVPKIYHGNGGAEIPHD